MNTHKIILGDCIAGMKTMPAECVQTCITSPPYWGLRDYGTATWDGGDSSCNHVDDVALAERLRQKKSMISVGERIDGSTRTRVHDEQIGNTIQHRDVCPKCGAKRIDAQLGAEKTPEAYVENMVAVFREVRRILRDDGTVWLNLGDSYWSNTLSRKDPVESMWGKRPASDLSDGRDNIPTVNKRGGLGVTPDGIKPKDLMGMPWRVAFALQADGWYLRQDIIWHKPNPMPESVTDRCTKSHEYIFLLSKKPHYYFDHEAIREPAAESSAARMLRGVSDTHKNVNGAPGQTAHSMNKPRPRQFGAKVQEGTKRGDVGNAFVGTGKRNKRSVWTVTTKPFRGAHFATFPKDLIEPCVLAGTSEHGCCSKCGTPWNRDVEIKRTFESGSGRSGNLPEGKNGNNLQGGGETKDIRRGPVCHSRTIGWEKTCNCVDAEVVPCTVFDPFTGSGTTAIVSLKHNRNFIGTELNEEYIKIAEDRIRTEIPQTLEGVFENE
jgi:DNA modification methylase